MKLQKLLIIFISLFIVAIADRGTAENNDNDILSKALLKEFRFKDDGYVVVSPTTSFYKDLINRKDFVAKKLKILVPDIDALIDKLSEKNKESVKLSLESSIKDGYCIDYNGNCLKSNSDGWEQLYKENPLVKGICGISLPLHDKRQKIVVLYISKTCGPLCGTGELVFYSFSKYGILKELDRVLLWVS